MTKIRNKIIMFKTDFPIIIIHLLRLSYSKNILKFEIDRTILIFLKSFAFENNLSVVDRTIFGKDIPFYPSIIATNF